MDPLRNRKETQETCDGSGHSLSPAERPFMGIAQSGIAYRTFVIASEGKRIVILRLFSSARVTQPGAIRSGLYSVHILEEA